MRTFIFVCFIGLLLCSNLYAAVEEISIYYDTSKVAIFNVALYEDDIINIMDNGLDRMLLVPDEEKLATTWANIKK